MSPAPYEATVLLVDDEQHVTESVRALLRKHPYQVWTASSAAEALVILQKQSVDVIVCDEEMPGMKGTAFLELVARDYPQCGRILLTGRATLEVAIQAINGGKISRLLRKPCQATELVGAIEDTLAKVSSASEGSPQHALGPAVVQHPSAALSARFGSLDARALQTLSSRELEILELVLSGQRLSQVAKSLFVSPHTVRNHMKAIFRKLDVHSQVELLSKGRGFVAS